RSSSLATPSDHDFAPRFTIKGGHTVATISRRDWLTLTMGAGAALALKGGNLFAQSKLLTRAIPSSGEALPVIGLGSSATFSRVARTEDVASLREVMQTLVDMGGTVFDTAPSYGASEEVAAEIVNEARLRDKICWATKLNVAGRDGGPADPAEARKQVE